MLRTKIFQRIRAHLEKKNFNTRHATYILSGFPHCNNKKLRELNPVTENLLECPQYELLMFSSAIEKTILGK